MCFYNFGQIFLHLFSVYYYINSLPLLINNIQLYSSFQAFSLCFLGMIFLILQKQHTAF